MRKFHLLTIAASGLAIGLSALASAASVVPPSRSTLPAIAAEKVDYTWNHHQWHHRDWDKAHHRWNYHD
jgi:hypothetical protein